MGHTTSVRLRLLSCRGCILTLFALAASPHMVFGQIYPRSNPIPPTFNPPADAHSCRYELKETLTVHKNGQPEMYITSTVDYALLFRAHHPDELVFIRVQGEAKREDYHTDVDTARPGDLVRIESGSDTLLFPELVQWFALFNQNLVFENPEHALGFSEGSEQARSHYLSMHPAKLRAHPFYAAQAHLVLSDEELIARVAPTLDPSLPDEFGRYNHRETSLSMYGLQATGFSAARIQKLGANIFIETKAIYEPAGSIPDFPAYPHGRFNNLSGSKQQMFKVKKNDLCWVHAAEQLSTQVDWSLNGIGYTLNQTRIRLWNRK